MPIKWSAVKVSEAMDMAEEFVNQADEPLEQAKIVATEARKIANLPRYLDQHLIRLIGDIKRVDYVKAAIKSVRNSLPDGALEAQQRSVENGSQATLKCKNTAILRVTHAGWHTPILPKLITKGGEKDESRELV